MTQENYLKYLKLKSKNFARNKEIFEIIIYGSFIKGKEEARDIDILIIFKEESLVKRTELAQEFKGNLNKIKNLDIKTINLSELFDKNFLARQSVLIEGKSLIDNKSLAEKIGFKGYSLFEYSLRKLTHNEKTKFVYGLSGRNKEGILKKIKAIHIGKGVVLVPIRNSIIFEDFLKKWNLDYNQKNILMPI